MMAARSGRPPLRRPAGALSHPGRASGPAHPDFTYFEAIMTNADSPAPKPLGATALSDVERVYRYWFGRRALDAGTPYVAPDADSYRLDSGLWFRAGGEVAQEIRTHFGELMQRAA